RIGSRDCILPCQTRARSSQVENGSAVSFQSDRRKTRCSGHKSSARSDHPRAAAQNRIRAVLRSVCKIADRAGTRRARPAASPTSGRDNRIALALRAFAGNIAQEKKERRNKPDRKFPAFLFSSEILFSLPLSVLPMSTTKTQPIFDFFH